MSRNPWPFPTTLFVHIHSWLDECCINQLVESVCNANEWGCSCCSWVTSIYHDHWWMWVDLQHPQPHCTIKFLYLYLYCGMTVNERAFTFSPYPNDGDCIRHPVLIRPRLRRLQRLHRRPRHHRWPSTVFALKTELIICGYISNRFIVVIH